ncbi:hypothetical protein A9Q99_04925, partial [Gammaproteobacteria bacterium 45_16_T64]
TITVQAKDAQGNNLTTGSATIVLSENGSATISSVTDNSNGTYTATITNTVAEVITISGTLGGSSITDTAAVIFTPGAATTAQTSISTSPSSITADGVTTATITVQTKDAQGNSLTTGGATIALSENGSATISSVTDNSNGTYTATITNTVAEAITISGTLGGSSITDTAAVTFTPGAATTAQTTISASPTSVTADGTSTSTVTVQAIDAQGNNLTVGGDAIVLSENGSATISSVTDNSNGTYTATITNTVAEAITISGTLGGSSITDTAAVTFTPGVATTAQTSISASPSSITADGVTTATITVQTKDAQGNNLTTGGATIVLSENGSASISSVTDNSNGTYTATITNTVAEAITISGTLGGSSITDTAAVTFTAGAATTAQTTINASPTSVTADGTTTSTITVQAIDAQGNNLTAGGDAIVLSENGSAIISSVTDNSNGTYTATITNTVSEVITISGTLGGSSIADTAAVTFTPGAAATAQTTITASPTSVTADGTTTSTITVQTIDAQGNNLTAGGDVIVLSENGSAIISSITDNSNGTYTATITNTVAEAITISGTLGGSSITDTAAVTFTPGAATTAQTTITASPTSVTADGTTTSTITVQAVDAQGNNLTTGGATIALSENGSATISSVTDNSNGTYTATITNIVAEAITVSGTLGGASISDTAAITFTPGAATTAQTTIIASPTSLTADGITTSSITVQAKDAQGNNLTSGGATIVLSENGNATLSSVTDNSNGTYSATITNTVAEAITVSGTLNGSGITDTAAISFVPGTGSTAQTTISLSPTILTADGTSTTTVTVQVKDTQSNNLVAGGDSVTLSENGNGVISTVTDLGNGQYSATVTNTTAESLIISGTLNGSSISDTANVTFIPGSASVSQSIISVSPTSITADGSAATITVQAKDNQDNNLQSGGLTVALSENGSASLSAVTDNSDGTYTATISNLVAEAILISGTIGGTTITDTASITFTAGAGVATTTDLSVSSSSVTADGTSTAVITVQVKDTNGNNVTSGGATILLAENGSASISTITDVGDGTYTATISDTVAELITISGSYNGANITDTTAISFVPGTATASQTTISASPTSVTADGTTTSTITVQTKDAQGNNVTSGGATIVVAEDGNGTLSAVTDVGNGTYTATVTNTLAETLTISGTLNGSAITDTASVTFTVGAASTANTTISVSSASVTADGTSTSTITVQTVDSQGNLLATGGDSIALSNNGDGVISTVVDNSDGTYTASISNTTAEAVIVSGDLNSSAISDTANITFTPGAASTSQTTLAATPTSLLADGATTSTVTVQIKDAQGNNLTSGGHTIVLSNNGSATIGTVTDVGNGTYTATVVSTTAESITVSGTLNGSNISSTINITFTPGSATTAQTTISATPTTITADGSSNSTITVQTKDVNGNNLNSGGATIVLTQDGSATLSAVTDNSDGTYTATVSSTTAESITVSGSLNASTITNTTDITFISGSTASTSETTITVSPTTLTADGTSTATITVQAKDNFSNDIVSGGLSISLSNDGNAIISSVTDNSDGTYTATITNTTAENITISGMIGASTITDTAALSFIPGVASTATTTLIANTTTLTADGTSNTTLTIQTKDAQGNNLTAGGDTLVLSQNGNASISTLSDNGDGTYTATITNTTAETVIVSATLNGSSVTDTDTLIFTPGAATTAQSTISVSPTSVVADNSTTATITVQLIDAQGNFLTSGGSTIALSENGSATISAVTDNADGTYTATIRDTIAEGVTITGTLDGSTISDNALLTFTAGSASTTQTNVSATPTTVTADGTTTSTVTVQVKDGQGNNLTVGGATIGITEDGSATLSSVTDNSDGTYTATVTNTTAETITISATLNGSDITDTASVTFIPGAASTVETTIAGSTTSVTADGTTTITITLQTVDANSNLLTAGGDTLVLSSTGSATLGTLTDNSDGTYTTTITNSTAEPITISGTLNGSALSQTLALSFTPGIASTATTTISASPSTVTADGTSSATITLQTRDAQGNDLTSGGDTVSLSNDKSATISSITDNNNGTYTTTITNVVAEAVTISGNLNGSAITDTANLTFTVGAASALTSQISVAAPSVIANGVSSTTVTLQAIDAQNNTLTSGGDTVILTQNGSATLGGITDNGDGTYTATITNTVAETLSIGGTINSVTLTDTAALNFIPGAADVATTQIIGVPGSVTADGVSASAITVQLKDSQGNNLTSGGHTIVIAQTGSATLSSVSDNGDGTYSATATNTVAETVTISGTLDGTAITDTTDLIFIAGNAASAAQSTLSASPTSVTADGTSTSTITVQAKDAFGNNLTSGGLTIALSNDGSATINTLSDNGDGTYTATINSVTAESVTVSGTLNGSTITDTETLTFTPGAGVATQSTVSVSLSSVTADGTSTTTVTVQINDAQGNAITTGGQTVALTSNGSTSFSTVSDLGNGSYQTTATNTVAEAVTISGSLDGSSITDTASVTFTPGTFSAANTTITGAPTSITANGVASASLTIQVNDSQNNNLTSGGHAVALTTSGSANVGTVTDNGDGTYTAQITNTVSETVTINGTINGSSITDTEILTFISGSVSASTSLILATPSLATADGASAITVLVQTKDAQGNNLTSGGHTIALIQNGSAQIQAVTDNTNGTYQATVTSTVAETVILSGTINSVSITDTEVVIFSPGAASETTSTLAASPASITADGVTNATITLQAKDAQGNNLTTGGSSVLFSTTGDATLSAVTDLNNGTYEATITNTTAELATISATLAGQPLVDTTTVSFNPGAASVDESTIDAVPIALLADGTSTAIITLQAKDSFGNNLNSGGLTVTFSQNGSATITTVIDLGDGTYIANISNTVAELITLSAEINSTSINDTDEVSFIAGSASPTQSLITASPSSLIANGTDIATITVQTKDDNGNNLTNGGLAINLTHTTSATLSSVTDNGDGSYTATLMNTTAESVDIFGTLNGVDITDTETITFLPGNLSAENSTIIASPAIVTADGMDVSLLTIQTFDIFGNPLTTGGDTIVLSDNNNATLSPVIDQLDGTYTATISNSTVEVTLVTGTLNGTVIIDDESISFVPGGPAQINASDGNFINGFGPPGSAIVIHDEFGNTICTSTADNSTGKYHCLVTHPITDGQQLTVTATDLANNSETSTITVQSIDDDDDGISNLVEALIANTGGASNTAPDTDTDGDGLPDYSEIFLGSDLLSVDSPSIAGNIDSDMDGITDAVENYFTNAGGATDSRLSTDTDGDGIPDITELITRKSDFNHADFPLVNGTADSDGDNVTDAAEFYLSTFLITNADNTTDYDRDGYPDAIEVRLASDPLRAYGEDSDTDGVNDAIESYLTGTINDGIDSLLLDRDNDDLPDIYEIELSKDLSDPTALINDANNGDADGDGLSDAIEQYLSGDNTSAAPNVDRDGDGIIDEIELAWGSNPFVSSTPVVWIDVADVGGGSVELFVRLGGFQAPHPEFTWDTSEILSKEPGANISNINNQQLTISGLAVDIYTVRVNLSKTIDGQIFTSTASQRFTVSNSGANDSDYDGISDNYDTFDATMGAEENLHSAIGFTNEYQIQLQYGSSVRAGSISRMGKNEISTISFSQLSDYANGQFPIVEGNTETNNDITSTANLFDIEITNLPSAGDTIDVVLPLNRPLASDAAVLWFNHSSFAWSFFDTTASDIVSSTTGSPGNCPPVDDTSYTSGLTPGSYCLKLSVTDGGNNDHDNGTNGVIPLLMGIGNNNYLPDDTNLNDGIDNSINPGPTEEENGSNEDTESTEINNVNSSESSGGGGGSLSPLTLMFMLIVYISAIGKTYANPENGTITVGSGSIVDAASLTTITQDTDRMAIEWDSFDIANGETVTFVQPDSSSIVLNQDFSGSASQLFGNLNANGQVILLNSAGILMGETASINVASFFASDLSVDTDDFADGNFILRDLDPLSGGITNLGNVQSFGQSGIYVTGQYIQNEGNITSSNGDVRLSIADQVIVSTDPSGLIGVEISNPIIDDISPSEVLVSNDGNIVALNGNIYLDLYYSDAIKADTVNNTGIINAVAISAGTGNIELTATSIFLGPSDTSDVDGIISESLPDDIEPTTPTVEIELSPNPKVSINSIMPDCDKNDEKIKDCNKYQAIKRYLGRLLLGGQLPDATN